MSKDTQQAKPQIPAPVAAAPAPAPAAAHSAPVATPAIATAAPKPTPHQQKGGYLPDWRNFLTGVRKSMAIVL